MIAGWVHGLQAGCVGLQAGLQAGLQVGLQAGLQAAHHEVESLQGLEGGEVVDGLETKVAGELLRPRLRGCSKVRGWREVR